MFETAMNGLTGLISWLIDTHGKPLALAATCSFGVWLGFGWLVGPVLRLPVLRHFEPAFLALRPLISFGICWAMFYRLHADGVLDLGAGPTSWARAAMWAILGSAGTMLISWGLSKRGQSIDDEAARRLTDAGIAAMSETAASVVEKIKGGPTPPTPDAKP